jgi:hypothetical protein
MTHSQLPLCLRTLSVLALVFLAGMAQGQGMTSTTKAGSDLIPIGGELSGGTVTIYSQGVHFSLDIVEAGYLPNFHFYAKELNTSFPLSQVCHVDRRHLLSEDFCSTLRPWWKFVPDPFWMGVFVRVSSLSMPMPVR